MSERRRLKLISLVLAGAVGAAGIAGFEFSRPSRHTPRIIGQRILAESVDYSAGIDLVVSGRYGTPNHNQPFLSHYDVSCEDVTSGVVHSETIIGDRYSLENFNHEVPDKSNLCIPGNTYLAKGIEADTNAVLAEFDHHFNKAHPDLGEFDGAATRIDFSHDQVGIFREAIVHDAKDGFGVIFDPRQKPNKLFQILKAQVLQKVGNANVDINAR